LKEAEDESLVMFAGLMVSDPVPLIWINLKNGEKYHTPVMQLINKPFSIGN